MVLSSSPLRSIAGPLGNGATCVEQSLEVIVEQDVVHIQEYDKLVNGLAF
jgi:hypothetical protein